MVRPQEVSTRTWSAASPDVVYALLRDGSSWPTWSVIGSFALEHEGREGGESLGAIRVFRTGLVKSVEEIVALEPNRRFGYRLVSGLPVRDYRSFVDLEPGDGGTTIHWHSSFTAKIPGTSWFWRRFIRRVVTGCAEGLARHAATSAIATRAPTSA
jgi:hypothetical protein